MQNQTDLEGIAVVVVAVMVVIEGTMAGEMVAIVSETGKGLDDQQLTLQVWCRLCAEDIFNFI